MSFSGQKDPQHNEINHGDNFVASWWVRLPAVCPSRAGTPCPCRHDSSPELRRCISPPNPSHRNQFAAEMSSDDEDGPRGGFLEGGKKRSFAQAFSKVLSSAADAPGAKTDAAPILAGSGAIKRRQKEERESERADSAHRKHKEELKRRGHVAVPKKGEDPEVDKRERALSKLATKGVVRLFNAVSKARASAPAGAAKGKEARLARASLLKELDSGDKGGNRKGDVARKGGEPNGDESGEEDAPGMAWAEKGGVLGGGGKRKGLKDWERDEEEEEDLKETLESDSSDGEEEEEEGGW